jgi:hypothetical protein
LDDLKLKEGITTIREVGKYPMKQRWQERSFPFSGTSVETSYLDHWGFRM